jgi:hypothetical protein
MGEKAAEIAVVGSPTPAVATVPGVMSAVAEFTACEAAGQFAKSVPVVMSMFVMQIVSDCVSSYRTIRYNEQSDVSDPARCQGSFLMGVSAERPKRLSRNRLHRS